MKSLPLCSLVTFEFYDSSRKVTNVFGEEVSIPSVGSICSRGGLARVLNTESFRLTPDSICRTYNATFISEAKHSEMLAVSKKHRFTDNLDDSAW